MQRRGSMTSERTLVLRGGVAFVRGQPILGILLVIFAHAAIAIDLGDDGSRGDGEAEAVAVNDGGFARRDGRGAKRR